MHVKRPTVFSWFLFLLAMLALPPVMLAQPSPSTAQPPAGAQIDPSTDAAPTTQPVPADLDSPRSTMFTFLKAMNRIRMGDESAIKQAVQTMAPTDSPIDPHLLADQLLAILDRIGEVKPEDLPDAQTVKADEIQRYRYFPRTNAHDSLRKKVPGSVDPRIIFEPDNQGHWRFSAQTVRAIPGFYDAVRDLPAQYVANQSPIVLTLGPSITKTTGTGWTILLTAILLGVIAGKTASTMLERVAQSMKSRDAALRAIAISNTAGPVNLLLITVGLSIGIQFIYSEPALQVITRSTILFLYIICVGWLSYNLVDVLDAVMRRLAERTDNKLDDQVVPLIRKSLRIFLVILFSLVMAQNVFGLDITGWLAGLGIAGLAISLAAQDSIRNLFGSITVFFDRPFMVGDWIKIGGTEGQVEEVGFRSTRIRTATDSQVTLPNSNLISAEVDNLGSRRCRRWRTTLGVEYGTTPDQLLAFTAGVRELIRAHPYTRKSGYEVWVNNFGPSSIDIILVVVFEVTDMTTELREKERLMLDIMRLARALEVSFAFPTQTVHVFSNPGPQPEKTGPAAPTETDARQQGLAAARRLVEGQEWSREKPVPKHVPELPPPVEGA